MVSTQGTNTKISFNDLWVGRMFPDDVPFLFAVPHPAYSVSSIKEQGISMHTTILPSTLGNNTESPILSTANISPTSSAFLFSTVY